MDEMENKERQRDEIYSKAVRAGKRTYFFDVKSTKSDDYYLTITESKKRFSNEEGKFHYEKHKLFLYKEDFEKFSDGLSEVIEFIKTGNRPVISTSETPTNEFSDVSFEDLKEEPGKEEEEKQ
jgi:hypothetical protein